MSHHLAEPIQTFSHQRVLVVGDVMLDRFIYGQVDRISPEAPIPVFKIQREVLAMGGAGNVARNLVSLGAQVDLVGLIGQDQAGYDFAKELTSGPGITSLLITDSSRPTTRKTRYIANGQQMLRTDFEVSQNATKDVEDQVLMRVKSALTTCALVILSDYSKGVLTERVVKEIISFAKTLGKPVLIDPKGRDYGRYRGATLLTPNRKELAEATHLDSIKSVEQAEQAARVLITAYQLDNVLAKLGGDGVCLVKRDGDFAHFRTQAREVFDVSGAGDTVVATLALAMASGMTLEDAAMLANLAGSIVVGKVGTATVTADELIRELHEGQTRDASKKIVTAQEAFEIAERWRKQSLKVGFTNGCFDLVHPGHLSLLNQSRGQCDRLIVGLNTDASVKRLKGPARPVQNEQARALLLASLSDVDLVVLFDEETPLELIKTVRPHLLVKGADYKPEQVVGWPEVKSWGGELYLADLKEGHSTTNLVTKIKAVGA